jgi:hypothetical protein
MATRAIDLQDIPEPIAQAIEAMVHTLREQIKGAQNGQKHPVTLPVWEGKPLGELSREEIYDDAI